MGYVIRMPQMGMSMDQGTVVEWVIDEGESIDAEEPIVVVESEKASNEVEAREAGVLRRIIVDAGNAVGPGTPIGIVAGPDEDLAEYESDLDLPDESAAASDDPSTPESSSTSPATSQSSIQTSTDADVKATPGARQLAEAEGVDLGGVEGTGPQGVITDDDVEAHLEGPGAADDVQATPGARQRAEEAGVNLGTVQGTGPQGVITKDDVEDHLKAAGGTPSGASQTVVETRELSGVQATISERLSESYREAVHVTLNRSFDTGALKTVGDAAKAANAAGSITDLLIKAVGDTLATHPAFNSVFEAGEHRLIDEANIGIAVDVEAGLMTPVLADVGVKTAEEVNAARRDLTERVQTGSFTMDDLSGGTFTISNLGLFGIDDFNPIINPPQVAILGVGRIRDDGDMTLSLSFDHRVVNGADAARFLDTLVDNLTAPETLAGYYAADIDGAGDRPTAPREIQVENASGYSGQYRTAFGDVAFDEPEEMGGSGSAPAPVDHLIGALGACLSLSLRAMAGRDDLEIGAINCTVNGSPEHGDLEAVDVQLSVETDEDEDAVERAVTKAERACYVSRSLADDLPVEVTWERA